MTETLYLEGVRGTIWLDADNGVWVVSIPAHERTIEARSYDLAIAAWELAVSEITQEA